jgi:hypothetical protein
VFDQKPAVDTRLEADLEAAVLRLETLRAATSDNAVKANSVSGQQTSGQFASRPSYSSRPLCPVAQPI